MSLYKQYSTNLNLLILIKKILSSFLQADQLTEEQIAGECLH